MVCSSILVAFAGCTSGAAACWCRRGALSYRVFCMFRFGSNCCAKCCAVKDVTLSDVSSCGVRYGTTRYLLAVLRFCFLLAETTGTLNKV